MKIKLTKAFKDKLNRQVLYISKDKPQAARKFKNDLIEHIRQIPIMPYSHRKSIFLEREDVRDLVFKGYIIVYRINKQKNTIEVFGFSKFTDNPFM